MQIAVSVDATLPGLWRENSRTGATGRHTRDQADNARMIDAALPRRTPVAAQATEER